MFAMVRLFKLLSDTTRLRVLLLIARRELCVCQIMGVTGVSQPLISRNLSLLSRSGLIIERKEGKLVFYSLNREMPEPYRKLMDLLKDLAEGDTTFTGDIASLAECEEFQKETGKCDMKTFREFMKRRSEKVTKRVGRRD
jgi:ArsR family transcriptional regulator